MTLEIQNHFKESEISLIGYLNEKVNSEEIAKFVDMSASELEPGCVDVVCAPLRKGGMPDESCLTNKGFSNSFEYILPGQADLHWCISEFIFSVPEYTKILTVWEQLYLEFCFWYCETWYCCDEEPKSLINMIIIAIKLEDERLTNLLIKYIYSIVDLKSIHRRINRNNLLAAIEILNISIVFGVNSFFMPERKNIYERIFVDGFDPEVKELWMDAIQKLSKLDIDNLDAVDARKLP